MDFDLEWLSIGKAACSHEANVKIPLVLDCDCRPFVQGNSCKSQVLFQLALGSKRTTDLKVYIREFQS